MEAASGQPDRIPSIEAPSALYRQLALQAPSRRRSARIAQMNWTGPCCNLTSRRSKRPSYFWLNGKEFLPQSEWACHLDFTFGNILTDGSSRMTKLSVGPDKERFRLRNDWKAHVFKKAICSVGGHVPWAGCACQNGNGILADGILACRSRGMEAIQGISLPILGKNCELLQ